MADYKLAANWSSHVYRGRLHKVQKLKSDGPAMSSTARKIINDEVERLVNAQVEEFDDERSLRLIRNVPNISARQALIRIGFHENGARSVPEALR